jgi:hypothetical protein
MRLVDCIQIGAALANVHLDLQKCWLALFVGAIRILVNQVTEDDLITMLVSFRSVDICTPQGSESEDDAGNIRNRRGSTKINAKRVAISFRSLSFVHVDEIVKETMPTI